jgi:hypothetical protein
MKLIDITGRKFGRLAVVSRQGHIGKEITWLCKCDCGKEVVVLGNHLRRGAIVSCGCFRKENASRLNKGDKNPMFGLPREKNPMMRADVRATVSKALSGKNNPMYGKTGNQNPMWGKSGKDSPCWGRIGDKHPNWKGGISFEPYCDKFNGILKESVRDKFNRKCFNCDKDEKDNGRLLGVHHTDYNKMQGCGKRPWCLLPMCSTCHSKSNYNRWYWFAKLYNYWAMPYMQEGWM